MKLFQNLFKSKTNKEGMEQDDPEPRLSISQIEEIVEQNVNEKIDRLWNN
ncbi:MAG: hypothetical protein J6N78_01435 [Clostridia bacterium]|nr:hypothetical protein [Clostridia bacterium]